jgi:hypothetical protein
MSVAATPARWCTTCGDYVRPGTHGIHRMSFTGGEAPATGPLPERSAAAVVGFVVLAIVGAGAALFGAAWLLFAKR